MFSRFVTSLRPVHAPSSIVRQPASRPFTKMSVDFASLDKRAQLLKSLHVPGTPLILTNAYDASTAALVANLPRTKAIATASYAIAEIQGYKDNDLTLEHNLQGISYVVRGLQNTNKFDTLPLSADVQDGYADPVDTITRAIKLGVVGCNIEDVDNSHDPLTLRPLEDAVSRIELVRDTARQLGVPNFVINARCDAFGYCDSEDDGIEEVIRRGKAYLAAGATSVFVWGVMKVVVSEAHIARLAKAFDGQLAVQPGIHSMETLGRLGVCRVSVGPALWRTAQAAMKEHALAVLGG